LALGILHVDNPAFARLIAQCRTSPARFSSRLKLSTTVALVTPAPGRSGDQWKNQAGDMLFITSLIVPAHLLQRGGLDAIPQERS
jgi:hypothetical protein